MKPGDLAMVTGSPGGAYISTGDRLKNGTMCLILEVPQPELTRNATILVNGKTGMINAQYLEIIDETR